MSQLIPQLIKSYQALSSSFKHSATVHHQGGVIAFALSEDRRFYYTTLQPNREGVDSPYDSAYWDETLNELPFPKELAHAGFEAAGAHKVPETKDNSQINWFKSSTARLTAVRPFQVISDGKYILLFRQSIDSGHMDNISVEQADGGQTKVVDQSLLVDWFVYVDGKLQPKRQVRFQRSRNRSLPASRKDSLDAVDMDGNVFFEPTQELSFVGKVENYSFTVQLLPTALPDLKRWSIAIAEFGKKKVEVYILDRGSDGSFDTRGTQLYICEHDHDVLERKPGDCPRDPNHRLIPVNPIEKEATYLHFNSGDNDILFFPSEHSTSLHQGISLRETSFTIEFWLNPMVADSNERRIIDHTVALGSRETGFHIYHTDRAFVFCFHDRQQNHVDVLAAHVEKNHQWHYRWHHWACVYDAENNVRSIYCDGQLLAHKPSEAIYSEGHLRVGGFFAEASGSHRFAGGIDELRLWNRARSQGEIRADMNHLLLGREQGLLGYWQMNVRRGEEDLVLDSTPHGFHGKIRNINAATFKTSNTPLHYGGIQKQEFFFEDYKMDGGLSAVVIAQQEEQTSGYEQATEPMKSAARLLLAIGVVHSSGNTPRIAVVDLAISRLGNLTKVPNSISLKKLKPAASEREDIPMPWVYTDKQGLTMFGGLLDFAVRIAGSRVAPQLFASANGRVSLYYQGRDKKLMAAHYDVLTARARFFFVSQGKIWCIARAPGSVMDTANIQIEAASNAQSDFCNVRIRSDHLEEYWSNVSTEAQTFSDTLNGRAKEKYNYAANAPSHAQNGSTLFVIVAEPTARAVSVGMVAVRENASRSTLSCHWVVDHPGSALKLRAPLFVTAPHAEKMDATRSSVTLEAWIKPDISHRGQIIHWNYKAQGKGQQNLAIGVRSSPPAHYPVHLVPYIQEGDTVFKFSGFDSRRNSGFWHPQILPGKWSHLAFVHKQAFGVQLERTKDQYLSCRHEASQDLSGELTIEAAVHLQDSAAESTIVSKGSKADGYAYQFCVAQDCRLTLIFQNVDGQNLTFHSEKKISIGVFQTVAVTRTIETDWNYKVTVDVVHKLLREGRIPRNVANKLGAPDIINIDFAKKDDFEKALRNKGGIVVPYISVIIKYSSKSNPRQTKFIQFYIQGRMAGRTSYEQSDSIHSSEPLEVGKGCNGSITDIRLWNITRSATDISKKITGKEKGLVSFWRFSDKKGARAEDSKGGNHLILQNAATFVPVEHGGERDLYVNGLATKLAMDPSLLTNDVTSPQFTLGAVSVSGGSSVNHHFQGEIDEVRVWGMVRTQKQILENLARRLVDERCHLIAYYDIEEFAGFPITKLRDCSGNGHHLDISQSGGINDIRVQSRAPISTEAPQVKNVLAGVDTPYQKSILHGISVQEYSSMQVDDQGREFAVLNRCYVYLPFNNVLRIATGHKVGELLLEWVGQAQYDPAIIGYIEGAPPVPSENFQLNKNYEGASSVELTEAESSTQTYSKGREDGLGIHLGVKGGVGSKGKADAGAAAGAFSSARVSEWKGVVGIQGALDLSGTWTGHWSAEVGTEHNKLTKVALRGHKHKNKLFHTHNMGLAIVQSETADIFAMRLKHPNPERRSLVALSMRPNPDIPKDWNILTFPINPRYSKQGTLDGRVGLTPDSHYPNTGLGQSYFKPLEAYALKNRIVLEEEKLKTYYRAYQTALERVSSKASPETRLGAEVMTADQILPKEWKRNIVNSYVWTSDGGWFAETEETMDVRQEVHSGNYTLGGMAGLYMKGEVMLLGVYAEAELDMKRSSHLGVTLRRSDHSKTAFGMKVSVNGIDSAVKKDEHGNPIHNEYGAPFKKAGSVDAYRFMTFHLAPNRESFEDLERKVIDPNWLAESRSPDARAMREALKNRNGQPWRVFHRVTYVSRVLPQEGESGDIGEVDKAMQAANIGSNYEMIRLLEPFVKPYTGNRATFREEARKAIKRHLPELSQENISEQIIQYLELYFNVHTDLGQQH